MTINPYLSFDGGTLDALEFYAEIFGSQVEAVMRVRASPMASELPAQMGDRLMHARVRVGDNFIMASDTMGQPASTPQGIVLQIAYSDLDKAKRVFDRLAKGGEITMPFEPTFWAKGFGICKDRFGIPWMGNCEE